MSRKAAILIAVIVVAVGAGSVAYLRSRPASRPAARDGMQFVSWAMHACFGLDRVGQQTTTVAAGNKRVTSRVEVAYRRPGMTRLRYLDGPLLGVQVWEDLDRVYRYVPEKDRLEVTLAQASEPDKLEQRLQLMRQNYTAEIEGEDLVAGRPAHRIALRPRHPGNPWKRLWIDRESYLMLGSEDYDAHDHLLRSTRFVSLSLRTEPESTFRPKLALLKKATWNPSADDTPLSAERVAHRVGFEVLLPKYLPPGYRLLGSYVDQCQCGSGEPTARTQYTDGLNTISLFQCGHPCAHGGTCWTSGAPEGVAARLARGADNFMVVGELDKSELQKMIRSVPPRNIKRR
jgi:negative regulator of sigma E activity